MGLSFRVAKVGTRYKPKLVQIEDEETENASENDSQPRTLEGNLSRIEAEIVDDSDGKDKNGLHSMLPEVEASFSLSLFKDGFSIGKATKLLKHVPKQLHPYDKASEALFSAIEYGWLPGEILDDILCKFVNGALLCEIQDYRNCEEVHNSPTGNSPIVHKVILQMGMETVVKDILSISSDTWTYKDLLEIESCILRALQPDLCLNPESLWDNINGEPPRKKLNLGIAWSWKNRKLSDVLIQSSPVRNSNLVNHTMADSLIQKSNPQSGSVDKDKRTTCVQEGISSCFCYPQGINHAVDSTSPSHPLVVHKSPNFASVANQLFTSTITPRIPRVPSQKGICGKQAIEGVTPKKPKHEPVNLCQLQHLGSQANIALEGPDIQWMDNALPKQLKVDKILCEHEKRKLQSPLLTCDDQMVLQEIQNPLPGAPVVKQEPAESVDLHTDYLYVDRSIDQSNLHNSKQQLKSMLLRANSSSIHTLQNHMAQPSSKNLKKESATLKRKFLKDSEIIVGVGNLSATSQTSNSLQRQAPVCSRAKCLRIEMADSIVGMRSMNVANANSPTVRNLSLPQPSIEVDNAIERLFKILRVTKSYGLTNRKHQFDQFVGRKPFFNSTPQLVGFHLSSFADSVKSRDFIGDKISHSKYSSVWKTRTLIYSCESHFGQRSDRLMVDRDAQIKLVMSKNLELGTVEARVYHGCKGEINSISFPVLPTIPSTCSVELFTTQFTSLMVREGYCMISDLVESSPFNKDGESGIEIATANANLLSVTIKLPPATWTAGLPPPMHSSLSSRLPFHDPKQFQLANILSGFDVASSGDSHLSLQLTHSCLTKPQLHPNQQLKPVLQQWQQGANIISWLPFLRRQEQELCRNQSMVELSVAAGGQGTAPLNDGIHMIRNVTSGSCSSIEASMHYLKNISKGNNVVNDISVLKDKQHFDVLSDNRLPALPKLSTSHDLGRGLISGMPNQRSASVLPIAKPDAFGMKYMLSNHQELKGEISPQVLMVQQQEIRSMLKPQEVVNLADHVGSPPCLVISQQDQLAQSSTRQLNFMLALQRMNPGNISVPGCPDIGT